MLTLLATEPMPVARVAAAVRRLDPAFPLAERIDDVAPESVEILVTVLPQPGLLGRFPNLRLIFVAIAGVDYVLRMPDRPVQVPVVRTVDPGQRQLLAQYVIMMLVRHTRGLAAYEQQQRERIWHRRVPIPRPTVGILGLGPIGEHLARALVGLGFAVRGWSRGPRSLEGVTCFAGRDALPDFLRGCEALVCLLPLNADTHGLLDRARLSLLPRGALLINVGRGEHVVTDDLIALLDSGHLSEAVIDVTDPEPPPPDHPLWAHPKVLLTPHVAAPLDQDQIARQLIEARRRLQAGEPLVNRVV